MSTETERLAQIYARYGPDSHTVQTLEILRNLAIGLGLCEECLAKIPDVLTYQPLLDAYPEPIPHVRQPRTKVVQPKVDRPFTAEHEAKTIAHIRTLRDAGKSWPQVAQSLTHLGIPTPQGKGLWYPMTSKDFYSSRA